MVVLYKVAQGRDLRYTYARAQDSPQLVLDVQFVERGGGDRVRRIYEPATAAESDGPTGSACSNRHQQGRESRGVRRRAPRPPTGRRPGTRPAARCRPHLSEDPRRRRRGARGAGEGLRAGPGPNRDRGGQAPVGRRVQRAAQFGRGHLRLRQHHHRQRVDTPVRLAVRVSFLTNTTATLSHHNRPVLFKSHSCTRAASPAVPPPLMARRCSAGCSSTRHLRHTIRDANR